MGYDYTLVSQLAESKNMMLDLNVASSLRQAMKMLEDSVVDLVSYEVPVTAAYNSRVTHCGPVIETTQVLVQPAGGNPITDVTQLIGRDVYVMKDSKYQQRLDNLNSELGGGIRVHAIDRDTVMAEDLLAMVAEGKIPLTVVDSHIARLNRTYYPTLDVSMPLSFKQKAQWAVSRKNKWLADSINAWFGNELPQREVDLVTRRYFQLSKNIPPKLSYDLTKGRISPYDAYFRKYASPLGWDWRLLAAQGYVERRFDNSVTSWAGATGIMQIMPGTARAHGVSPEQMRDPETSIRLAAEIMTALDKILKRYVTDPAERRLFVLAAYNSGGAHIIDAINLAKKYHKNPAVWHGNVEDALLMKADPQYYNDPVCKYGYFRGRQTVTYVREVSEFYARCRKHIPQ